MAATLTILLTPNAQAQKTLAPPPNARLITLNPAPGRFTEPKMDALLSYLHAGIR